MIFFYVLKNVQATLRSTGQSIQFKPPRPADITSQRIPTGNIYFTTHAQFDRLVKSIPDAHSAIRVFDDLAVDMILNRDDFPRQIGFHRPGEEPDDIFREQDKAVKIAVINGMGTGIGDSIVGLRALDIFHERIMPNHPDISIDMFQRINPALRPVYQRYQSVNRTYDMPQTLARLLGYDYFMSLEAFTLSQEFNSMPMIDYYLAKLGMDPSTVSDYEKRNTWPKPAAMGKNIDKALGNLLRSHKDKGYRRLLIHPVASDAIRSVPDAYIARLIEFLIDNTDFILFSAVPVSCRHERFHDISRYSKSIEDFIGIISRMDAVITVDTSTFHIADCFDVPTVVLFNTIHPRYRISYYPHVRGIWLGEGKDPLSMRHGGFTGQDKAILDNIYKDFDYRNLLNELDLAIQSVQSEE